MELMRHVLNSAAEVRRRWNAKTVLVAVTATAALLITYRLASHGTASGLVAADVVIVESTPAHVVRPPQASKSTSTPVAGGSAVTRSAATVPEGKFAERVLPERVLPERALPERALPAAPSPQPVMAVNSEVAAATGAAAAPAIWGAMLATKARDARSESVSAPVARVPPRLTPVETTAPAAEANSHPPAAQRARRARLVRYVYIQPRRYVHSKRARPAFSGVSRSVARNFRSITRVLSSIAR